MYLNLHRQPYKVRVKVGQPYVHSGAQAYGIEGVYYKPPLKNPPF